MCPQRPGKLRHVFSRTMTNLSSLRSRTVPNTGEIIPAGWHRREPGSLMSGPDLDELLDRVAERDHDAFTSLYDSTANLVFSLSRRVVVDPDLAAEVSQEVFLEMRSAKRCS